MDGGIGVKGWSKPQSPNQRFQSNSESEILYTVELTPQLLNHKSQTPLTLIPEPKAIKPTLQGFKHTYIHPGVSRERYLSPKLKTPRITSEALLKGLRGLSFIGD